MSNTTLLEYAKDTVNLVKYLKERLQQTFQNLELPHQERWEHFLAFYELGGCTKSSYYSGWDNIYCKGSVGWYDEFNCDRYQTLDLVAAIDSDEGILTWEEVAELPEDITNEQFRNVLNNHPKTKAMREALMADAVTHMINDW